MSGSKFYPRYTSADVLDLLDGYKDGFKGAPAASFAPAYRYAWDCGSFERAQLLNAHGAGPDPPVLEEICSMAGEDRPPGHEAPESLAAGKDRSPQHGADAGRARQDHGPAPRHSLFVAGRRSDADLLPHDAARLPQWMAGSTDRRERVVNSLQPLLGSWAAGVSEGFTKLCFAGLTSIAYVVLVGTPVHVLAENSLLVSETASVVCGTVAAVVGLCRGLSLHQRKQD